MNLVCHARRFFLYSMMTMMASLTFSKALVEISFAFSFIFFLIHFFNKPQSAKLFSLHKPILFFLFFYLLCVLVSLVFSEYPKESFRGVLKILQAVMIFIMALDLFHTKEDMRNFQAFFIVLFLVMIINAIFQYGFGFDFIRGNEYLYSSAGRRLRSAFKTYGLFANYLNVACLFVFLKLLNYKKMDKLRLLYFLLFILGCYCLFLTRSRGAWVAFIFAILGITVLQRKWLVVALLALLILWGYKQIPRHMLIHLDSNFQEQSVSERLLLWERAIDVIKAKPVIGTGINTYSKAHGKYDERQSKRVRGYYAHNGYLQTGAEIGLPGLFFFVGFIFSCVCIVLYVLLRQKNPDWEPIAWLGGNLAFLVFSLFDTVMHNATSFFLFTYTLGLMMSSFYLYRNSSS